MTVNTVSSTNAFASAIADATAAAERALTEARIPIHILLSAQFGDLNDNQEEMLGAAATALDHMAQELATLRAMAQDAVTETPTPREDVRIGDLMRALQPELRDQAVRTGVSLVIDIEPALPAIRGTGARLRDAIRLALTDDIRYAIPGSVVTVTAYSTPVDVVVTSCCGATRTASGSLLLAERLLRNQGARLEHSEGRTTISVPRR